LADTISVVVLHYLQNKTWKDTLRSILSQDYPSVELVFMDDCSPGFDINEVGDFIRNNSKGNLVGFELYRQPENVGTVENFRQAHDFCTGKYLTHIAADDAYISNSVLSSYVECLSKKQEDVLGVYGQSYLCNRDLVRLGDTYFEQENAMKLNTSDSKEQFFELSLRCCIPMGATAFIREEYIHHEVSNNYRLVEDWPFFINATRKGKRFFYGEFDALLYRDGGISRNISTSPTLIQCFSDTLNLYENDVFPYISVHSICRQMRIYYEYNQYRIVASNHAGELSSKSRIMLLRRHPKLMLSLLFERIKSAKLISLFILTWLVGTIVLISLKTAFLSQICFTAATFCCYSLVGFVRSIGKIFTFLTSKRKS